MPCNLLVDQIQKNEVKKYVHGFDKIHLNVQVKLIINKNVIKTEKKNENYRLANATHT